MASNEVAWKCLTYITSWPNDKSCSKNVQVLDQGYHSQAISMIELYWIKGKHLGNGIDGSEL